MGFDAAKHMEMPDSSGTLSITSYTRYMSVTDNQMGNAMRNNVNSGNASGAASATGKSEYCASSGNIAYIERGTSGAVLVNCGGQGTWVSVNADRMADGTYTDQVSGNTFTVFGGTISGNIGSTGIAVVYNTNGGGGTEEEETDNVAYIKLPSGWQEPVYCYAYDSATETVNNGEWTGQQTTKASDGIYRYEVPSTIKDPRVIFYSSDSNC